MRPATVKNIKNRYKYGPEQQQTNKQTNCIKSANTYHTFDNTECIQAYLNSNKNVL